MDTSISDIDSETERALTRLVVECTELTDLEALLSRFNIFRVLRAAKHEIRHSNMLAWLLTPDESHGLGDRFFRRWLMRVVHNADDDIKRRLQLPSPIEIDALDVESVAVARERTAELNTEEIIPDYIPNYSVDSTNLDSPVAADRTGGNRARALSRRRGGGAAGRRE